MEANWLAGNATECAVLEATVSGPALRFNAAVDVGIAGADLSPSVDGVPAGDDTTLRLRAGSILSFGGRRSGARSYVAISGGIEVPDVLGSRSTDIRSRFGGFRGRPLQRGDAVPIASGTGQVARQIERGLVRTRPELLVLPGLHPGRARLCEQTWTVELADRQGIRLSGGFVRGGRANLASFPVIPGCVQLPPDGKPIVLLADAQPTGGYPVIGVVPERYLPALAQLIPGDDVTFKATTLSRLARDNQRQSVFVDLFAGASGAGALW
jgi:antagonist of KipI